MLTQEIKKKIDSARDILVGKVPDPKAQVEQITTALIYKFMDDMDKQAASLPKGKAQFFTNGFEKYAWSKMMDAKLGGQERLNLYVEAIAKMGKNPHLPQLFRDVFKDAFLPYRDPETLNLFLKDINTFSYDHSENLGDAFEYLLSILGSQGDAGQFRTPRHIIDFIVEVVDPKKDETILDPACGTAGFLISAYKHILKSNKNKPLTPDEKKRLMGNLAGYDIAPDMVKLSLVNMYLHGFPSPNIHEYDTLTSEERWDERYDVMMANPPFMTPTGGIRPHKRFMVQANRSEVLFVDYIMEHLNNKGRAGIIVPEGIIFQSASAYKQLRKSLVEDGLYAVVSLPPGVFNPYSGVRTSILFFDNQLAKQSKDILFIKVLNDGFGLGAQRKPIDRNDLPHAIEVLTAQRKTIKSGKKNPHLKEGSLFAWAASKEKIAADEEYSLSGSRYNQLVRSLNHNLKLLELGELCDVYQPKTITSKEIKENGLYKVFGANGVIGFYDKYNHEDSEVLVTCRGATCGTINFSEPKSWITGNAMVVHPKDERLNKLFLYYLLRFSDLAPTITGSAQPQITRQSLAPYKIPLPPIEVQDKLVIELDSYQKMVDGAKQIITNYKPVIKTDSSWEVKRLDEVCSQITDGTHSTPKYTHDGVPFLRVTDLTESNDSKKFISKEEHIQLIKRCKPEKGDVLYSKNGTIGVAKFVDWDWEFSIFVSLALLKPDTKKLNPKYLELFLNSPDALAQAKSFSKSGTVTNLHLIEIKRMTIPLPDLEIQQKVVQQLGEERKSIDAAKSIAALFESKIKSKIAEVWGE
ncbi:MAG: hypothetical protein A3G04_01745 [Candidatus Taylorbacteria bacterium RIFCSPLOWO2_12_FULL_44_9]|nr:MAG: hypothetical protein A3G04_01745 [Candidatus Taylorbacteria bacterium RIFCSPLOWO2_12_FULL_44_9]